MYFGWWVVSTHFVAQAFAVGLYVYAWSILAPVVARDLGTDMQTMNYVMTIAGLLGLALPPIAGPLVDRWSARGLMLIGAGSLAVALFGMSVATSVPVFVGTAAIFMGAAIPLLGPMTGSAVVSRWFTEKRGRALGIAAVGTSVGGMLVPQLMTWGFAELGWRGTLQLLGAGVVLCVIPLLLFAFRDHPEREPSAELVAADRIAVGPDGPVLGSNLDVLRRKDFCVFSITLAFFIMCYTATLANLGAHAADLGLDVADGAKMMSLLALCGLLAKLVFGELVDRLPLRLGLWIGMGLTAVGLVLFSIEPSRPVAMAAAGTLGLATGGLLPVWNAMVAAIFGVANFGRVMGLMGPAIGVVVSPGFTLAGAIRRSTGSYVPAFQTFIAILVLASLLLVFLRVPDRSEAAGEAREAS